MKQHHHVHHDQMNAGAHEHHGMGHGGYDHKQMVADFRKRFFVVSILTVPRYAAF
jgi:Cu2+-exporting ATPase